MKMKIYETIMLPSGGLLYPHYKVRIGNLDGLEELERVTPTDSQELLVAGIMQRCLEEGQNIDLKRLCLSDLYYLMVQVSRITYGNSHKYKHQCPFCGVWRERISLDGLTVKDLTQEQIKKYMDSQPIPGKNDMSDKTGDKIKIKALNIAEIDELRKIKQSEPERYQTACLVAIIDEVNGKRLNPIEREKYASELSAAGKKTIISRHDKLTDFGVVLVQEYQCEKCQKTASYPFLVQGNAELFNPTVD